MNNQSIVDINLSLNENLVQIKEKLNKEKLTEKSIYSKDHLDKCGIEILTEMKNKTADDFIFEIISAFLIPIIIYCIGITIIASEKTVTDPDILVMINSIKELLNPTVIALIIKGILKTLDNIAYMSDNISWYDRYLKSHLLKSDKEYKNQENIKNLNDTELINTKVTKVENINSEKMEEVNSENIESKDIEPIEYDEVKLINQLESICEYCGGLYIHGKDIKCPHCYAPIPKIKIIKKT